MVLEVFRVKENKNSSFAREKDTIEVLFIQSCLSIWHFLFPMYFWLLITDKNFQLIFPFVSILIISKIKIIAQLILLGWKKLVLKLVWNLIYIICFSASKFNPFLIVSLIFNSKWRCVNDIWVIYFTIILCFLTFLIIEEITNNLLGDLCLSSLDNFNLLLQMKQYFM